MSWLGFGKKSEESAPVKSGKASDSYGSIVGSSPRPALSASNL